MKATLYTCVWSNRFETPSEETSTQKDRILPPSVFLPSKLLRATHALFKAVTKPNKNQCEHSTMIIVVKLIRRGGGCGQTEGHTSLNVATQTDFGETGKPSDIITCLTHQI